MEGAVEPGNGWTARAKVAGDFINRVGLPSVIVIFLLVIVAAIIFGKVESPVVTKSQFKEAESYNRQVHEALIDDARAQTKATQETAIVLRAISCELKHSDTERLKCFRSINQGGD